MKLTQTKKSAIYMILHLKLQSLVQKLIRSIQADAVEDAIEPVTKQTKKLEATIKTKRSIAFKAPKRFLFWKRGE